jgi:hypothetical protein
MTFEEILDQALAMLQRRGRVTYSALKRQFNLDDAFLEDLKEELLYGQRLVREEDGRVLVWIEGASPPGTSVTLAAPHQESADSGLHTRGASSPTGAGPSDAERRQLTVLFCDLVDSTALARQLDQTTVMWPSPHTGALERPLPAQTSAPDPLTWDNHSAYGLPHRDARGRQGASWA